MSLELEEGNNTTPSPRSPSISALLDDIESELARFDGRSENSAVRILKLMDQAYTRVAQLRAGRAGDSLSAEQAQWEYIEKNVARNASGILSALGGAAALAKVREIEQPAAQRWWWFLDDHMRVRRAQTARRAGLYMGAAGLVLLFLGLFYQVFLAPDPETVAAYRTQQTVIDLIAQGNPSSALNVVESALEKNQENPDLLLLRGILLQHAARAEEAEEMFLLAQRVIPDREKFFLTRATLYLQTGDNERTLADAQAVVEENPRSAEGTYILGKAYELMGDYDEAVAAYQSASLLAHEDGNSTLEATIRLNMATMMQAGPPSQTQEAAP